MRIVHGRKGRDIYYVDDDNLEVTDKIGNKIKLFARTDNMPDNILAWNLDSMFRDIYMAVNDFKFSCEADASVWKGFE